MSVTRFPHMSSQGLIASRIPTSAHACGLLATIIWGVLSDRLRVRTPVALAITLVNLVSCTVLAASPSIAGHFFGYIINAATFAYGPIMIVSRPLHM